MAPLAPGKELVIRFLVISFAFVVIVLLLSYWVALAAHHLVSWECVKGHWIGAKVYECDERVRKPDPPKEPALLELDMPIK